MNGKDIIHYTGRRDNMEGKGRIELKPYLSAFVFLFGISLLMFFIGACGGGSDSGVSEPDHVTQEFASGWASENGIRLDDPYAWNPDIVEVSTGGYRMYFEKEASPGERNIYSAFSDDGLAWEVDDGIRIPATNMPGAVITSDGKVRVYFNRTHGDGLGSALSDNGLDFVVEDGIRILPDEDDEAGGVKHPCVIRLLNNSYRMFYDAADAEETYRIKTAVSNDGLTWTKQGVVIDPSMVMSVGAPELNVTASSGAVIDNDGLIRLFFTVQGPGATSTRKGIYMASSENGIDFTVQPGPVISEFSVVGGQGYGQQDAAPVFTDKGLRVYYWVGAADALPLSAIYSVINHSIYP
jgi:predicted GH43/DUF377 family glycosyl hydrolase